MATLISSTNYVTRANKVTRKRKRITTNSFGVEVHPKSKEAIKLYKERQIASAKLTGKDKHEQTWATLVEKVKRVCE